MRKCQKGSFFTLFYFICLSFSSFWFFTEKFRLATYCGKEMGTLLKNNVDILARKLRGDDYLDDPSDDESRLKPAAMTY